MKATVAELEAVTTVARLGGFRAAARELGVSSSALSHAVAALEARLGVRLFNRTTRSVVLTSAGDTFVAEVTPALIALDQAIEGIGVHQAEPSGTLRLNTSPGAARTILEPLLLEYLRRYPRMSLELVTDNALVDVIGQGFDAGLRLLETVPPDMIAVPVTRSERMIVVGAPAYLDRHGVPRVPQDLLHHACIRARMASGRVYRWEFAHRGEAFDVDVPGVLTLDDSELMQRAALAGAGLALVSERSASDHLEAGRLVQVLAPWTPAFPGLCLYYPGRRQVPAKLRALIELIGETLGD